MPVDQMLIEMPRVERVPTVQFGDHGEVAEPVVLERLLEIARRVRRDVRRNVGDPEQLRLALRIAFLCGQFACQRRVALRKQDHRVAGNVERLQRLAFVERVRVIEEIELCHRVGNVAFEVQHSLPVNLVIEDGVAGGALLHELGENPGGVRVLPLLRQLGEQLVAHRTPAPVGNDPLAVSPDALVVHAIPGLGTRIQNLQILDAVAGQFRKRRHELRRRPALAHDEFAVADVNRLVLAEMKERLRAHHRHGIKPGAGLVKFRDEKGAFR